MAEGINESTEVGRMLWKTYYIPSHLSMLAHISITT